MAKAQTPHPLRGKIGKLIFKVQGGKQLVYQANSERKKSPNRAYNLNIDEFAGAAKIGQSIHRFIKPDKFKQRNPAANADKLGPIFRPYAQNYLIGRLKKYADLERKRHYQKQGGVCYATEFRFYDVIKALQGLDLSREGAPSGHLSMVPIGPQHNPTAIHIEGLQHAARAMDTHGQAVLECRFHIRQCEIMELDYDPDERTWHRPQGAANKLVGQQKCYKSQPTDWIPVEIIPRAGITLPLSQKKWLPDDRYLTAIMIEWREVRTIGRRSIRHHQYGIARIAALHAPATAWLQPSNRTLPDALEMPAPPRKERKPRIDPKTDPQAYLAQALGKLHEK